MGIRTTFAAATAAALILAVVPARAGELIVFDWPGYEDQNFFPAYMEKYGEPPTFSFFADEEEAFQKMRAGFKADLGHPCSQSVPKWHAAGLLKPLDTTKIAAWDDVMPEMRDLPGFNIDGEQYMLPLDWGATALTYRTDAVTPEQAATLQSFADPAFAGRVSIVDNVDDAYALGLLATGVTDWTNITDEQFEAASDFLRKVHENIRAYWQDGSELAQLMASGEVTLAWAWNETATTLQAEGHPVEMNRDTLEGSSTWVCGYVRLADGPASDEEVYDFLNAWLEERVAEYIVTEWGYGHSNGAGLAKMDQDVLKEAGFTDLAKYQDSTLVQSPLPFDMREKMIAEFEKIKAGF